MKDPDVLFFINYCVVQKGSRLSASHDIEKRGTNTPLYVLLRLTETAVPIRYGALQPRLDVQKY